MCFYKIIGASILYIFELFHLDRSLNRISLSLKGILPARISRIGRFPLTTYVDMECGTANHLQVFVNLILLLPKLSVVLSNTFLFVTSNYTSKFCLINTRSCLCTDSQIIMHSISCNFTNSDIVTNTTLQLFWTLKIGYSSFWNSYNTITSACLINTKY